MNVYVRELATALARTGAACDVFTRAWSADLAPVVELEPGLRVHHIAAGPPVPMAKERLVDVVDQFTAGVLERMTSGVGEVDGTDGADGTDGGRRYEAVHANYWLSGLSGHAIKHQLDLPLMSTFHTLDRVKAEAVPEEVEAGTAGLRAEAEAAIIRCSDAVLASCTVEARQIVDLYGADSNRIAVIPPGVDHAFFGPGHGPQARRALGLPVDETLLLFVGRIQPLKGADVAVRTLAALNGRSDRRCRLVVVGGPSGPRGDETYRELVALADHLGVGRQVHLVEPQPHELLSTYYRAADVCLVPSRSESFGLVALEAAACGTPVMASAVGGLTTLVDHGRTGFLVDGTDPAAFAWSVERILGEPLLGDRMATAAVLRAREYTWADAAARLRSVHDELVDSRLVECT
jgi:D-inositol-3-phosphate glycosyltransferase